MSGTTRLKTKDLHTVLGKAIQDPKLANDLKTDPEAALKGLGYTPHPEEIAFFKTLAGGNFTEAVTTLHNKDPGHYSSEL